jgi:hypothetical protein
MQPGMDYSFGEILQAAAHDDPKALTNRTLWSCDTLLEKKPHCQNGLDLLAVITTLRHEARIRGIKPEAVFQSKHGE